MYRYATALVDWYFMFFVTESVWELLSCAILFHE
jgi:hypothetical protein